MSIIEEAEEVIREWVRLAQEPRPPHAPVEDPWVPRRAQVMTELAAYARRAKDRAAAAERRVAELEAAARQAARLLEYPATVQAAEAARGALLATLPQDAPEPPAPTRSRTG